MSISQYAAAAPAIESDEYRAIAQHIQSQQEAYNAILYRPQCGLTGRSLLVPRTDLSDCEIDQLKTIRCELERLELHRRAQFSADNPHLRQIWAAHEEDLQDDEDNETDGMRM